MKGPFNDHIYSGSTFRLSTPLKFSRSNFLIFRSVEWHLSFYTNSRMRLDTHLIKTQQKVIMEKRKLSQLSPYMNFKQRKVIYSTKLKSLVDYCHPLLASQPQQIRKQAETLNMMINRWILKENTFALEMKLYVEKLSVQPQTRQ